MNDYAEQERKKVVALVWASCFLDDWDYDTNSKTKLWHNKITTALVDRDASIELAEEFDNKFPCFDDFLAATSKNSRLYRTFLCFNLARGGVDWGHHQRSDTKKLEDHHIFPKDWIRNNRGSDGTDAEWSLVANTVLNRILVSQEANSSAKAQVPPNYLGKLSDDEMSVLQIPRCFLGPLETPIKLESIKAYFNDRFLMFKASIIAFVKEELAGG